GVQTCALPIFRHRTARLNEISGRYSVMRDEFYLPREHEVRYQSSSNKQGSDTREVPAELRGRVIELLGSSQARAYQEYEELLADDVARDLARINLPLSLYTEMYWQIDLNNLFHFLRLRLDWHAQYEIRAYGDAIATAVRAVCPAAYRAFEEHILHGRSFSRSEVELLLEALDRGALDAALERSGMRKSRRAEFLRKLERPADPSAEGAEEAG